MPLSPPWQWMMHTWPEPDQECWVVRIGGPEKPFLGVWNWAANLFDVTIGDDTTIVYAFLVLKWRPLDP